MDELLKELACFGCRYSDDCDKEWTEGFCVCDHMKVQFTRDYTG